MPPSSSSKPVRFDPLRLLSEIQSDPAASSSSTRPRHDDTQEPEGDEEDFMSDKFLATTEVKQPLSYTDKRRKLEAHHARKDAHKSLRQREEEAREQGLDRDLLAEAEIIAGGGRLPPEGKDGARRWDLMQPEAGADRVFGADDVARGGGGEGSGRGAGEDGTAKAMRMMLAMGYRRGEALGRRMQGSTANEQEQVEEEEEDSEAEQVAAKDDGPPDDTEPESLDTDEEQAARKERDDSQAREEDEYLTGGVSSAPFGTTAASTSSAHPPPGVGPSTQPLRPDQRWLGLHRRAGIGMIPKTAPGVAEAIRAKVASSTSNSPHAQSEAEHDFRTRVSRAHRERHEANLLSRARKTLIDLDRQADIHYSPLWLDAQLYHLLSGHTPAPAMDTGTIDERMQTDAAFAQAVELLQLAFTSRDAAQVEEASTFCNLEPRQQLDLLLSTLRSQHAYCLFCGCQYSDVQDLQANCPGEAEDEHD